MTTTLLPAIHWVPQQRAWGLNGLHAAIVGTTPGMSDTSPFAVLFWDGTRSKEWPLPGTVANTNDACCAMLPDIVGRPAVLVVAFKSQLPASFQQTFIRQYLIPVDPFTAPPTPPPPPTQPPAPFGDENSANKIELVYLPASGTLIACTHQHISPSFDSSVRLKDGSWHVQARQLITDVPSINKSYQFGACWAPWGDLMWIQDQYDSSHQSDGATFAVVAGKLERTKVFPAILNGSMGELAINQEIVSLCCVTDAVHGQVCTSYTNTEFDPANPQQMAKPVIAGIKDGVVPVPLAKGSMWVVSILNWSPVVVQPSRVTLAYVSGRPQTTLHCDGLIAELQTNQFAAAADRADFVIVQPDGAAALIRGDFVPDPSPIPIPEPLLLGTEMISFSWSLSDPTNSGAFWLEKSASRSGLWTPITNFWQVSLPGKTAVRITDSLMSVDGVFYRLRPNV